MDKKLFDDLCARIAANDDEASRELITNTYNELRAIARRLRRNGPPTVTPTELVHEAVVLKLGRVLNQRPGWERDQRLFLGFVGKAMIDLLVERGRRRVRSAKLGLRPGSSAPDFDVVEARAKEGHPGAEMLREALVALYTDHRDWFDVAQCLYFQDLTQVETALRLGVSERTVRKREKLALGYLGRRLKPSGEQP